ncbi:adenylate/guanylate cyclase domain-containing protein [Desulfobacterales bacterium HSG17]|nr:adenylate/guanylate cyclase domain-containing protein [Desulfobacterales bacterium HSG17]
MFKKRLTKSSKILAALVFSFIFASFFPDTADNLLKKIENRSLDYRFLLRGPKQISDLPIVIVFIDNPSALEYGYRSPTPRKLLADLLRHLTVKGAKTIGMDVLLDRSYHEEEDIELEKALKETGNKVVLVEELHQSIKEADTEKTKNFPEKQPGILPQFYKLTHQGFSASKSEGDDYHRWVNLGIYEEQKPFAITIFEQYTGTPVSLPDRLDLNKNNPWMLLNFPGQPTRLTDLNPSFEVISASEVSFVPEVFFRDKIVLIGSSIEDLGDTFLIPFSTQDNGYKQTFGVELHAITLSMLLTKNYIFKMAIYQRFAMLLLLFILSSMAFLLFRPLFALACLPLCMLAWSWISVYFFINFNLIVPIAYPLAALILIFILCQWLIYSTELKHSRFLKNTFQHYIAPQVLEQMVSHGEKVSLGGKKEELTIFFSDLKGFTSTSEKLSAEEMVEYLNLYFEKMTRILFRLRGTLDKYIGDAVMAFFGAPNPQKIHASRACRAAILMQHQIASLNENPESGWVNTEVRIGINTDRVIVGNTGSQTRFSYTVIGDGVNLASRLEGVNKLFGSKILISESTQQSYLLNMEDPFGPNGFFTRELGRFVVKGKIQPVAVYELIDFNKNITAEQKELKESYEDALFIFYKQDFKKAEKVFTRLHDEFKDQASAFMLSQIRHFLSMPPVEDWKGEIVLLSK